MDKVSCFKETIGIMSVYKKSIDKMTNERMTVENETEEKD